MKQKTPAEIHAEVGQRLPNASHRNPLRAFTESDIAKIIADAKAEEKGVCEWKEIWGGFQFCQKTGCGHLYKNEFIDPRRFGKTFCPGCGKEIKVV